MGLLLRTALAQIEQAIVTTLRLALLERDTVADIAALRARAVLGASGTPAALVGQPVYVTSAGFCYQWSRSAIDADNGFAIIRPTEVAADAPGRWLRTTSRRSTGYVKAVNLWQGETRRREFHARMLAARPSLAVLWESSANENRSTVPGAIYDYPCKFSVWCIDENLRPDYEAMLGSGYAADADHPGVIALLGDVKKALADENKRQGNILGLGGGAKVIVLGSEDMEEADLAERVMILSIGVEVMASVENPDDDDEHLRVDSIFAQPQLTQLHAAAAFDPDNFVISGLRVQPQSGLVATPTAGRAVLGGVPLQVTPGSINFAASSDSYLDLVQATGMTGALVVVAVSAGAAEPDTTPNALRVARVVTDSLGIVSYEPLAATSDDFGDAYQVLPPTGETE